MPVGTWSLMILLVGLTRLGMAGEPRVEVEEVVAQGMEAHNGAGPLWCYGAPLVVRVGEAVYASVMEVGDGVPPPCNTRWRLLRRDPMGWVELAHADQFREREPCPIAASDRLGLLLSVNPSLEPPGVQSGRCDPHLLRWDLARLDRPPTLLPPAWPSTARFSQHSYRGLTVDPVRGDALVLNIDDRTNAQHWSILPADHRPDRSGSIRFPVRACYPEVALVGGAGHVLALGDQVEPNLTWKKFKQRQTGKAADYVFRQVYYTCAADLGSGDFAVPVEVDTVEATGGNLLNLDLWIGPTGLAHLLYLKTNMVAVLRDQFWPGQPIIKTLEYVVIDRGAIVRRATLLTGGDGQAETPEYARFHATDPGNLHIVAAVFTAKSSPNHLENWIMPIPGGVDPIRPTRLPLKSPFKTFFTATPRGGSVPSTTLDLFGHDAQSRELRYARVILPGSN